MKFQQRFRCEAYNVFTEKVNKAALSANGDKRIQMPDGVISYPYGSGPGTVCKAGFMRHPKIKNLI